MSQPIKRMSAGEAEHRIDHDPDFVKLPRFDNSIEKVIERYPDGAPTRIIAAGLGLTELQVHALWMSVVNKLRKKLVDLV